MFKGKEILTIQEKALEKLDDLHDKVDAMLENFKKLQELLEKKKTGRPRKAPEGSYKKPIQKG